VADDVDRADPLAALAADATSGDAVAVRRLLDAVAPAMLGVIRAVLGGGDRDAEDVLQDSLVGLIQGLSSFRGDSSFLHFARSIALRRSLDQRRKRARRRPEVALETETAPEEEGQRNSERELRSNERSPVASALAARRREAFRSLLEDLRPEQAEAFAQRVLLGHSMQEIARQMQVPLDTVKSRLRLAKAALRARIQDDPTLLELSETDDVDAI
jgi:RNA polymerase sigma-70 factor (ECF subfamily)